MEGLLGSDSCQKGKVLQAAIGTDGCPEPLGKGDPSIKEGSLFFCRPKGVLVPANAAAAAAVHVRLDALMPGKGFLKQAIFPVKGPAAPGFGGPISFMFSVSYKRPLIMVMGDTFRLADIR